MANLTTADVEAAMTAAPTIGDRLVALVSLRKQAFLERQTAMNEWKSGILTEDECEVLQDTATAVLAHINNHRIGIEALIQ